MILPDRVRHPALVLGALLSGVCMPAAKAADAPAPPQPHLEFLFEEFVTLGTDIKVGVTSRGERNITPITGGTVHGPLLKGVVLGGGWDWQLLTSPCMTLEANYFIRTDDGVVINVINKGPWCTRNGVDDEVTVTSPTFEAPLGKYESLNYGAFVGTAQVVGTPEHPAVLIRFFRAAL